MRKINIKERKRKSQPKCDICGEPSSKLFCNICMRRYNMESVLLEDGKTKSFFKDCSQCQFYKDGKCEITTEEVEKNYYCLYFYSGRKNV